MTGFCCEEGRGGGVELLVGREDGGLTGLHQFADREKAVMWKGGLVWIHSMHVITRRKEGFTTEGRAALDDHHTLRAPTSKALDRID